MKQNKQNRKQSKWKKKIAEMTGIGIFALFLCGCAGTELENKTFPLAVLIAEQDGQHKICYLAQQLSEVSNERANGSNMTAANASGSTYYETHQSFEKNNRCRLDMTHTKAVIFQKGFLESSAFRTFLDTVRSENTYARNTLVYLSDSSMEDMAKLNDSLEVPLGSYLEQMTENEQEVREQAFVTLGMLLNEQANASRILLIPVLEVKQELPLITSYQIMQGFEQKGRADGEEAQIYYLLAGQLQQMDVFLDKEEQVKLNRIKCRREFFYDQNQVTERIVVTAEAQRITGNASAERFERMLENKIVETCRTFIQKNEADLTDSGRYLAMYAPDIYRVYGKRADDYRKHLAYEAQVHIRMLS